ncbi:actin-like ATPase domain-containing protein [Clathrospora elynae]|uniref:Phosphotransferase n=1 Tax=Clathrospora elynae TaxID=706981 RepID=A0A6A5S9K6_9PLEO|nr:actin-like ATPase domain-containing protein [Clathrospora elynae]
MADLGTPNDLDAAQAIDALTGFINTSTLLDLTLRFSATYSDLARTSTEHFLVTPVTALPTGKEKGKFLSIDVGGTNLRVGFVELIGEPDGAAERERERSSTVGENVFARIKRSHDKNWPIGDHLKMDQAEDLFAWIGDCIAEVVRAALDEQGAAKDVVSPLGEEILLGITFSFPMAQTRLSEATLLPMGKGFAITSDMNLGKMLLAGYAPHCEANGQAPGDPPSKHSKLSLLPRIRVAAITNDTVATFASLAYAVKAAPNSRVAMGLIVGTGTNATVPMKLDSLHSDKRRDILNPGVVETVVINTEWTIRGTDKPLIDLNIKTPWDLTLDANSDAPGFQPFEYMTSGRYLGEIVRLVFLHVASKEGVEIPPALLAKNALPTRFLSEVIARKGGRIVQEELEKRYPDPSSSEETFWTVDRIEMIRDIAEAVQQRSSVLIATACVGLLNCVGDIEIDSPAMTKAPSNGTTTKGKRVIEELVIAYAGGTISQYPKWLQTCQQWIDILVEEGSVMNASKRVTLTEAKDGGIIGAGVLAGMMDEIA